MKIEIRKLFLSILLTGLYLVGFTDFALPLDYCFEDAGKIYNISPALLWAISKEESRFNPYAINFNANGTYDYGHMQINSWWADKVGSDVWATLGDPCQCTMAGAWILSQCIKRHGYTWEAVGCYHSKKDQKMVGYSWKIFSALKNELRKIKIEQ